METLLDRPVAIATAAPDYAFVYFSDLESRRVRSFGYGLPNPTVGTNRSGIRVYSLAFGKDSTRYFGHVGYIRVLSPGEPDRVIDGREGDEGSARAFGRVTGLAVTDDGTIYFSSSGSSIVRKVAPDGAIETVAGTSDGPGYSGDGGPATEAQLYNPQRLALDSAGNLYIADRTNRRIRRLSTDGTISTVAGNGSFGAPQPGVAAVSSPLGNVSGVLVDEFDNLYFTDPTFHQVLRVNASDGLLETVAGAGTRGFSGDDGPAEAALLDGPLDLAWGYGGALLIADTGNDRIRAVLLDGNITTIAGVSHFGGDGGPALSALLSRPRSVAVSSDGGLVIADTQNHRIRAVDAEGTITTIAGTGVPGFSGDFQPATAARLEFPDHLAIDGSGNIYFADSSRRRVRRIGTTGFIRTVAGTGENGDSGDGGSALAATFGTIRGLAVDGDGRVYVSVASANRIRRFVPGGNIEAFAGTGVSGFSGDQGPAIDAEIKTPGLLAIDSAGTLYLVDRGNRRLRSVTPEGIITTVAGADACCLSAGANALSVSLPPADGLAVDNDGNIFLSESGSITFFRSDFEEGALSVIYKIETDGRIWPLVISRNPGFEGDGGPAIEAELHQVKGLAVDTMGNVYLADMLNHRIRQLAPNPPASLEIIGGNNQTGAISFGLADRLSVLVRDAGGLALPNVRVDLSVLTGDATVPSDFLITDSNGVGLFPVFFGTTPSEIAVRASVEGLPPVDFALESVADPRATPPLISGGAFGAPWSQPRQQVLSSGGLAAVYGLRFFSGSERRQISTTDLVDGKLPTRFHDTCVLINGKRAFFLYAGGPQVNLQVPDLGDATIAEVRLIRDCELPTEATSATLEVPAQSATPEFFYWKTISGNSGNSDNSVYPISAVDPITGVRVGVPGLLGESLEFAPARPGELVDLYATGFGATDPPVEPGELPDFLANVVGTVAVSVEGPPTNGPGRGEIPVEAIPYVGATQFAGVYLLRIRLPADLSAGELVVRVSINGFQSPPGYIEVGN
ncbi:MAG: hypothetical protein O7F76_11260 [Planctomycetota bacterium]|nr:hypothetical protein [Planctomycetota bacterium]